MTRRFAALAALAALSACETIEPIDQNDDTAAETAAVAAVDSAADLVGLSEPAVRRALGAPDRTRPEGDVSIWSYRADVCVVDVYFYRDSSGVRARHAEARNQFGAPADDDACFDELRDRASVTS